MTWVWSSGEVCQGTIVQGSIWYHVCFSNESNNKITKMNWTRLQKSVEFENYIVPWYSSCSSCSNLEFLEHLESLRSTFLIRQCSSLNFAKYFEHNLGSKFQLRCLNEVLNTWVVTLFSPSRSLRLETSFSTSHHEKETQDKHSSSILCRKSHLCSCLLNHAIMPILFFSRCDVSSDQTISEMRELLSS